MQIRYLLMAILLCAALLSAQAQPPLAERLPSSTIAYAGWSGRSLVFDGSAFGQMLAEPGLGRFFVAMRSLAESQLPQDKAKSAQQLVEMGKLAWQHPAAVALTELKLGKSGPQVSGILLIDLARDREAFQKHLDAFLESLTNLTVTDMVEGGLPYRAIDMGGPIGKLIIGFNKNVLFVAIGQDMAATIISLKPAHALPTNQRFAGAMKEVGGDNIQVAFYMDVAQLLASAEAIETAMKPPANGQATSQLRSVVNAAGLGQIKAIAGTTRIVERGMFSRAKIFTPAPHRGLLMLLAGEPLSDGDLANVPADADMVAAMKISPETLYAEILYCLGTYSRGKETDLRQKLTERVAQFEDKIGVSISQELLPALGDTIVVSSAPSQGGFMTGTVLSITAKDPAKVAEVLGKIESYAKANLPPPISLEKTLAGRTEIHYVAGRMGTPWPIAPAWTIHENRLLLAVWPQVLKTVLDAPADKKHITSQPQFAKYRGRVTQKASAISYTNTPKIIRQVYSSLLMAGTLGTNALAMNTPVKSTPDWLPALSTLEKYFWPDVTAISSDETGIVLESYGSIPGMASLASPLNSPLGVSAMLPALFSARKQAKGVISKTNLRGLYTAIALYAEDNEGKTPADLGALMGRVQYVENTEIFISPLTGRPAPGVVEGKFTGKIDYIYINPFDIWRIDRPDKLLLMYERPENYGGHKTMAIFADGQIQELSQFELAQAIQFAEEKAKAASK